MNRQKQIPGAPVPFVMLLSLEGGRSASELLRKGHESFRVILFECAGDEGGQRRRRLLQNSLYRHPGMPVSSTVKG